jgi:hypothetical protein
MLLFEHRILRIPGLNVTEMANVPAPITRSIHGMQDEVKE